MTTTVTVHVESEPHTQDLSGVLLNRPAPSGGAFLISHRVPRAVWDQMKAAGAWYFSADDLEELDMFQSEPGWRYSVSAIVVLLRNGYSLSLRGQTITTEAQLIGLFTDEAKAAYRARIQAEKEAAERAREERAAAQRAEKEAKGLAYEQWRAYHLAGLITTTATPLPGADWSLVASFGQDTPGAWYTTGDRWYSRQEPDGATTYRRDYGNAVVYYATQSHVDAWVEAAYRHACSVDGWSKGDEVAVARVVIERHTRNALGDDVYRRLIELHGLERYLAIARSTECEWLLTTDTANEGRSAEIARQYGITHAVGTRITGLSREDERSLTALVDPKAGYTGSFYRVSDGRYLYRRDFYTPLTVLTPDQAARLESALAPKPAPSLFDTSPTGKVRLTLESKDKDDLQWLCDQLDIAWKKSWSKARLVDALVADAAWCERVQHLYHLGDLAKVKR